MAGFSNDDQEILAGLVRAHRRRAPRKRLAKLPHLAPEVGIRLGILLRLAVLLNRGRRTQRRLPFQVRAEENRLLLTFPPGYSAAHPLTVAELAHERVHLARWGTVLEVQERAPATK
jgi:exopolyphosphatase/guanosine-5'-triphosphate,3'-diphosphate pyrophosphatase